MATHSSTRAWEVPWTEEPSRLQPMGLQSRTRLSDFTFFTFFNINKDILKCRVFIIDMTYLVVMSQLLRSIEGLIGVALMNLGGSPPGTPLFLPPAPDPTKQLKKRVSLNMVAPELYSKKIS